MIHALPCGCTLCERLLDEDTDERLSGFYHGIIADATQEDLLCDPCREGVCAGAIHYNGPPQSLIEHVRKVLLGEGDGG